MQLTEEQKNCFDVNGYLIIKNYFTKKELDDFKEMLRRLIQTALVRCSSINSEIKLDMYDGKEFDEGLLKLESIDHNIISNIYDTIPNTPEFLRIVSKETTSNYINQLSNRDIDTPLFATYNRCRLDLPKDDRRNVKWHQEVFYSIPKSEFLQTWSPLIRDTTIENGSIEICPTSHKNGIANQSYDPDSNTPTPYTVEEKEIEKYHPLRTEMKLGDFMIFNSRLIHRSGVNLSKEIRFSLVGMYHNTDLESFIPPKIELTLPNLSNLNYYDEFKKN
mgnify:CR=1 FL=1|jgi:ectoine hydroxylase-related dioxygenase (phytanoyl-CoA dioxygenase family)|tara:strand:+ start:4368 stop:5195 length:828 start_codon:yes stop_codon:yes gene_type:complete